MSKELNIFDDFGAEKIKKTACLSLTPHFFFHLPFHLLGPASRFFFKISTACSLVRVAGSIFFETEALIFPSVTYGPKRPDLSCISPPLPGSLPNETAGSAFFSSRSATILAAMAGSTLKGWTSDRK